MINRFWTPPFPLLCACLHLLISLILCAQSCRRLDGILRSLDMLGWSKLQIGSWSRGRVLWRLSNQLYGTSLVHRYSLFCHIYINLRAKVSYPSQYLYACKFQVRVLKALFPPLLLDLFKALLAPIANGQLASLMVGKFIASLNFVGSASNTFKTQFPVGINCRINFL
jgi:hypothetical protein